MRTFFLVDDLSTLLSSIWVSENGGKITKFISDIPDKWELLNITNAPNNVLAIFQPERKKLLIYNFQNVKVCLNVANINETEYKLYEIPNFVPQDASLTKHFLFKNKFYYV